MILVAGLGNPGLSHSKNRHNIGFMAVDAIHAYFHFSPWRKKFQALIAEGTIENETFLLAKPQTFMNLSGQSLRQAIDYYKLTSAEFIVIHDELDLPAGTVQLKKGGSAAGHNGIKSVNHYCPENYRRIRLGIGHPGHKDLVHSYVLGDFSVADQLWLFPIFEKISALIPLLSRQEDRMFMQKIAEKSS